MVIEPCRSCAGEPRPCARCGGTGAEPITEPQLQFVKDRAWETILDVDLNPKIDEDGKGAS